MGNAYMALRYTEICDFPGGGAVYPYVTSRFSRLGRLGAVIVLCSVFVSGVGISAHAAPDDADDLSSPSQSETSSLPTEGDDATEDRRTESTAGESDPELTPEQLREVQAESNGPSAPQGRSAAKAYQATPQNDIPLLSISMGGGKTLADLNSSKRTNGSWPKFGGSTVSVQDPITASNNLNATDVTIRGRGNSTWDGAKKPYQISFSEKVNLLGLDKDKGAKSWVLLANHLDASMARNKLIYDLGQRLGMTYSPPAAYVDLVINGEYLGNYLLTDKVEVGKDRVNLKNKDGVLVELDTLRGSGEPHGHRTKSGTLFVLQDSKNGADDGTLDADTQVGWTSFQDKVDALDKALSDPSPRWTDIEKLIDIDSFALYYFIVELTENRDSTATSVFFYMDGKDDLLHIGPIWDYDWSLYSQPGMDETTNYAKNAAQLVGSGNAWFRQLAQHPEFESRLRELYNKAGGVGEALAQLPSNLDVILAANKKSAAANEKKWPAAGKYSIDGVRSVSGSQTYLSNWIAKRVAYLDGVYGLPDGVPVEDSTQLTYSTHVQNVGWQFPATNGMQSGSTGRSLRLEAVKFQTAGSPLAGSVVGNAHVQNQGWTGWQDGGQPVGSVGKSLRVEALQLKVTGELADKYDLYYRVHVQDVGWMGWSKNGQVSGTTGQSLRIESLEVTLVRKETEVQPRGASAVLDRGIRLLSSTDEITTRDAGASGTIRVRGWAFDVSDPSRPINTDVYVKRLEDGSRAGYRFTADKDRSDVGKAFKTSYSPGDTHGFDETIAVSRPGTYEICVYAAVNGDAHSDARCTTTNALASVTARGVVDEVKAAATDDGAGIQIRGWAFDPALPSQSIPVHVYVRDPAGKTTGYSTIQSVAIVADQQRQDVNTYFGIAGNHGLDLTIPVTQHGTYSVQVFAIGMSWRGAGSNPLIGTSNVTY
ncbi:CotH kinase family protein [Pseudoclavibacter sp. 13-3]|uniref:CotH kinase family protein n=1 Tax=Pseudoclavibacter sp. 13-3 TaxID=2901228 RepID=UPI001E2AE526|nr:CotH kinase family protein [Pseudoclavibacter sp. 13-3]MCD7101235.1 CotH kinase family protein [Pseudoclavibacter sp. 13-3]